MKNALTFWEGEKLPRSDIFIVPRANKSLSPATFHVARGAAYSKPLSDDVAPERSLGSLWDHVSINMSALTGLEPAPKPFCHSVQNPVSGFVLICVIRVKALPVQGSTRPFKVIQSHSRVFSKKRLFILIAAPVAAIGTTVISTGRLDSFEFGDSLDPGCWGLELLPAHLCQAMSTYVKYPAPVPRPTHFGLFRPITGYYSPHNGTTHETALAPLVRGPRVRHESTQINNPDTGVPAKSKAVGRLS
jgi:hypothetical protein